MPLPDLAAAQRRIAEVAEARLLRQLDEPLVFGGIEDVAEPVALARKGGTLDGRDLIAIGNTLTGASRLRRDLTGRRDLPAAGRDYLAELAELSHVAGPIRDAFDDSGRLADDASPALRGLRRRAAGLKDQPMARIDALLADPAIALTLSDRFYTQREERYVVPIRRRRALAGARHRARHVGESGQTVFVEPEDVVDLNNRLKLAELEVTEEERRILAELSRLVEVDCRAST